MTEMDQNENPALADDAALAMLRSAEQDQQNGNLAAAKEACETLIASDKYANWAYFLLGRIYRDSDNEAAAAAAFDYAIAADPAMFWAHCERLILAGEMGEPADHQTKMVDAFTAIDWEPLEGGALRKVELLAHAQWDGGRPGDAHRLFAKLWPSPELDRLTLVRIIEADRDAAMVAGAVERLEGVADLDDISLRILLQHYERRGQAGKQRALLDRGALSPTLALATWAALARSYAVRRRERTAEEEEAASPDDASLIARLRDYAAAGDDVPLSDADVPHLESIAHVLWDAGEREEAHTLFARMWPSPVIGAITLLRIVEANRDTAMVAGAVERVEALPDLDDTAVRILAQHHDADGDIDGQLALIDRGALSPALALQAWTGIARAHARQRQDRAAAGDSERSTGDARLIARLRDFAETFDAVDDPVAAQDTPRLESIAHVLWDEGERDVAHALFARLWTLPDLDVITLVRVVDANRDPDMVADAVTRLEAAEDLDETALRILLQHHDLRGDADRLTALLDRAASSPALTVRAFGALARSISRKRKGRRGPASSDTSEHNAAVVAQLQTFTDALRADDAPVPTEQTPHLEAVAHALWDAGDADRANALFRSLWPADGLAVLTMVRIVEADLDSRMVAEAIERLEAAPELDETALRVVGDHHARNGDTAREISLLERRRMTAPKDFQTWVALARSYAKTGDRERALATLERGNAFPVRQRIFARLIVQVELVNPNAALIDFRTLARLYDEVPKFPGIRLAYMFGDAFDLARRNEILGLLDARYPGDRDIALVQVNAAMRDQRWGDARRLFDATFAEDEAQPQNVRLAHIDILAFSGQLDTAHALLEQERVDGVFPSSFLRSTLRILGELERWDEAFDVGIDHLSQDSSFEHFLSIIVRAGRKTARSAEFFEALLALPRPLNPAQNDALFAVMEDLAEIGHADVLDRAGDIAVPYERAHRIQLKLRAASGSSDTSTKDLCIYYCADDNYLMPALVSLTALAMSNVSVARRAVFHLVVDSDVMPRATEAGNAIARRLGLTLRIVDAATIVSSADRLRTSYGLFTGGQQLALAAYYRIFFARHLVEQQEFSQALYVDADTIVRFGLEELFALERDAPIRARYETDRPEVRHATEVHQLKGRYFNSGVLHFNLSHPALPALLDRAIAAAIDPDVTLIFQDQCALNIAFDMHMSELPPRFNYFNPPTVSGDGIAATDAVIVHFLDRPKPWDSLYRRRAREWFEWFDLVETLRQDDSPSA